MAAPEPTKPTEALGERQDRNDAYRSPTQDPRELRSRSANKKAALLLIAGLVLVVIALALFT